jgi:fluoride exporter
VTILLITVAGGIGAVLRWLLDLFGVSRFGRKFPVGTITANVIGSCFAGALVGATLGAHLGTRWTQTLAIGFCGGLTTFSAASFDVARAMSQRRYAAGLAVFFIPMILAVALSIVAFHLAGG